MRSLALLLVGCFPVLCAPFGTTGEVDFMTAMQSRGDFLEDETIDAPTGKVITIDEVKNPEDLIIIGSGPAGLSAAIYSSRANLRPLVVAKGEGQLSHPGVVENFPSTSGTWDASGDHIMKSFKAQALNFGARFLTADVARVHLTSEPYYLNTTDGHTIWFKTMIVASGARSKKLGAKGEDIYFTRGVAYCATCDGWFYRNCPVGVVGGGDTAMETALFMSRIASDVYLINRGHRLRASRIMVDRAMRHPRIHILRNTTVKEFVGDGKVLKRVVLTSTDQGLETPSRPVESEVQVDAVFVAIGHQPNTHMFAATDTLPRQLELDADGYILTSANTRTSTSASGVFTAGDVADRVYRQAITSAGTGAMAALDAERHMCHLGC